MRLYLRRQPYRVRGRSKQFSPSSHLTDFGGAETLSIGSIWKVAITNWPYSLMPYRTILTPCLQGKKLRICGDWRCLVRVCSRWWSGCSQLIFPAGLGSTSATSLLRL
jgi:hypothetical protein